MNKFFIFSLLLFGSFLIQTVFAQSEAPTGPQPMNFEINTDQPTYHYTYNEGHEKIRIFIKIPTIIPNEKIKIESVYSRGPHTFTDTYSICLDITSMDCFSKVVDDVYVVESNRQYGNLFGQWALDAKYGSHHTATTFDLTTLNTFELDAAREEYTIKDLKDSGLELIFLGSMISNQTTLKLEIFKISEDVQKSVFEYNVEVETVGQQPYFNRLPITFSKVPFSVDKYNITATWGNLFDSDTFEIVDQVPQNNNGCWIATAAFGSELAPQVQSLREFRDSKVLSTISGTSFLQVFNAWYYSFSPTIAGIEKQNPLLQTIIKNGLYPLIGILQISQIPTVLGGETGIILTGFIASTLIGTVYMWPISIRFDFTRFFRQTVLVLITSVGLISYGLVFTNNTLLMVSTIVFVLASLVLGIILASKVLSIVRSKNKKRAN
ncbi:MAG: CFI-box-CTERM domain-containing protein [Nitrosopumilaceae archaeon]